jgi:hypothetical protein
VLRARADLLRELLLRLDMIWPLVLPVDCPEVDPPEVYAVPVPAVMCDAAPAGGRPHTSQNPSSMVPGQPEY